MHLIGDIAGQDVELVKAAARSTCEEYYTKTGILVHFSIDIEAGEIILFSNLKYTPLTEYLKTNKRI